MLIQTVEFDESDLFTLRAALDMLKQECQSHMETKPGVPQKARLSSLERIEKKLDALTKQASGNAFAASFEIERKAQSEFFISRLTEHGELPWLEIRALGCIGAGLLRRHLGEPKAIQKLARLAVPFDGFRYNETLKAMTTLLEDAAGGPYDPTEQDWLDLAALAGTKLE